MLTEPEEPEETFDKKVLRVDPKTQEPLAGAVIQLLDEDGTVLKEWTSSDETPEILEGLKPGRTYTIHEETAPEGYPKAPDSKVVLKKDGSLDEEKSDVTEADDGTLLLTEPEEPEETYEKQILRVDPETGEALDGAVLQLIDEDGTTILHEWTSSSETPEILKGLKPGRTYTIHEKTPPKGYPQVPDRKLVLKEGGSLDEEKSDVTEASDGTLLVTEPEKPEPEKTFNKKIFRVDPENRKPLPGAVLQLIDEDGTVLKEWTSSDETPEILEGLKPGRTYTIHEKTAPEGYPKTPDCKLVLKDDGSLDVEKSDLFEDEDGTLLLTEPETAPKTGSFELTKTIKGDVTEEEAEGSLTFIIKAGNGKYLSKDGKLVAEEKNAVLTLKDFSHNKGTNKYILKITTGETGKYTVTETTKDIDGKTVTAKYTTTVNGNTSEQKAGKNASVEIKAGKACSVAYENTYKNTTKEKTYKIRVLRTDPKTGKPVKGAVLKLIDKDTGKVIDTWTSTDTPHTVEGLEPGHTYIIHEESTPDGYEPAPDFTVTLDENGAIDKARSNVVTNTEGVILITKPKDGDEEEEGSKPEEEDDKPVVKPDDDGKADDKDKDSSSSSTSSSSTSKSPRTGTSSTSTRSSTTTKEYTSKGAETGDDTNAAIPAATALAALMAILLLLRKKKQQNAE